MKKLFIALFAIFSVMTTAIVTEAATPGNQIAVVIVGGADYRTKDFVKLTKDLFKVSDELTLATGKEVQNKYQMYWLDKGLIDEDTPTKEDFVQFVNYSGYRKVLYLVIKDSVIDQHGRKKGKDRSRASLTVNAFIVDKTKILKFDSSTNEEDSKTSELRARLGAFKQCVKEISKNFNPLQ